MDFCVKAIRRLTVFQFFLALTYFTSASIINCVQLLLHCTLRYFSKTLYRKINWYLTYSLLARKYFYLCQIKFFSMMKFSEDVCLAEWWSGSKIILYADKKDIEQYFGKEHAFVIMNHAYELDWRWCLVISDKFQILGVCLIK